MRLEDWGLKYALICRITSYNTASLTVCFEYFKKIVLTPRCHTVCKWLPDLCHWGACLTNCLRYRELHYGGHRPLIQIFSSADSPVYYHRGAWFEKPSLLDLLRQKGFQKVWITKQNRNQSRKYLRQFDWRKNQMSKILWHSPFKKIKSQI